ncbi:MAG: hypothetical protein WBA88_15900 [Pseudaminobacter sp.]
MTLWYDENNTRRGVLSAADFQAAMNTAGSITLFLAAEGGSTATQVASGVAGLTERRAKLALDSLVTAGLATEDSGTYTGVLVEDV